MDKIAGKYFTTVFDMPKANKNRYYINNETKRRFFYVKRRVCSGFDARR